MFRIFNNCVPGTRLNLGIYLLIFLTLGLSVKCTYTNPITGETEYANEVVRFVDYHHETGMGNMFKLRFIVGGNAAPDKFQFVLNAVCNDIIAQYGYKTWNTIDSYTEDSGFYRYTVVEVEFFKREQEDPCSHHIFDLVKTHGIEELTDRQFEQYKIKLDECNSTKEQNELRRQTLANRKNTDEINSTLYLLALVIWIIYAY